MQLHSKLLVGLKIVLKKCYFKTVFPPQLSSGLWELLYTVLASTGFTAAMSYYLFMRHPTWHNIFDFLKGKVNEHRSQFSNSFFKFFTINS